MCMNSTISPDRARRLCISSKRLSHAQHPILSHARICHSSHTPTLQHAASSHHMSMCILHASHSMHHCACVLHDCHIRTRSCTAVMQTIRTLWTWHTTHYCSRWMSLTAGNTYIQTHTHTHTHTHTPTHTHTQHRSHSSTYLCLIAAMRIIHAASRRTTTYPFNTKHPLVLTTRPAKLPAPNSATCKLALLSGVCACTSAVMLLITLSPDPEHIAKHRNRIQKMGRRTVSETGELYVCVGMSADVGLMISVACPSAVILSSSSSSCASINGGAVYAPTSRDNTTRPCRNGHMNMEVMINR